VTVKELKDKLDKLPDDLRVYYVDQLWGHRKVKDATVEDDIIDGWGDNERGVVVS